MNIDDITLTKGSHKTRETGVCAMEAAAWLAGEPPYPWWKMTTGDWDALVEEVGR